MPRVMIARPRRQAAPPVSGSLRYRLQQAAAYWRRRRPRRRPAPGLGADAGAGRR